MEIPTIGLDLAKNIFQVHGVTADGEVAFNRAFGEAGFSDFSRGMSPGLSAWRHAARAIPGRAS